MSKPTVGVFFGSRSAEHDVSIVTAISSIIKPLKLAGYKVVPVYISKDGIWYSHEKLADISLYSSGKIDDFLRKNKPVSIEFNDGIIICHSGIKTRKVKIDLAFPATHGTHGEDGHLMGVFEMAGIPYVGCDVASSSIAMDKVLSKQVTASGGIRSPRYEWCTKSEFENDRAVTLQKFAKLKFPLFVKPAHLGSSIGISRVKDLEELINGLEVAAHYDNKIIVEEAVNNLIEVTLPIMGNDYPEPALLEQPIPKTDGVFDFETKYMNQVKGGSKTGAGAKQGSQGYSKIPAEIPKDLYDKAEKLGIVVYKTVGCSGIARVDMLIDSKSMEVYFNELNPLPGSLYAHNWRAKGVSNVVLVEKLVQFALERHNMSTNLTTTFQTNFLKQFSSK